MFFLLSKLLAFTITPLTWIIILLFIALFSKNENRKKKCLRWSLYLTLFFSNSFIFNNCVRLWEIPATRYEDLKTYDYGILLGGMSVNDTDLKRVQYFRGVDRMLQAVDLYKRGIIKKIIFTGGSGRVLHPEMKEGEEIKPYLLAMGVKEEDLYIENESQNTRENALFTKELIKKEKLEGSYLLITSAFHMRRSLGCFNKVGMTVTPYSTDRYAGPGNKFEFDYLFIPNISSINDWTGIIHEMLGFIVYKISGFA